MTAQTDIHLYTAQTQNGIKLSITLEELGLTYNVTKIDISKNEQKEPWYLKINPNGRIPAITDTLPDGELVRVFESGSVMQYLVDRYDTEHKISYPRGSREQIEVTNWLFFLNAGLGPMQGQANHFTRYAPEKIQYGINRYQNETRRLYSVLEAHLAETGASYLVGDKCTIADLAHWSWIAASTYAGVDIDGFPRLKAWEERVWARPAVRKGADVPSPYPTKDLLADKERTERHALEQQVWIQRGMKEEAGRARGK